MLFGFLFSKRKIKDLEGNDLNFTIRYPVSVFGISHSPSSKVAKYSDFGEPLFFLTSPEVKTETVPGEVL